MKINGSVITAQPNKCKAPPLRRTRSRQSPSARRTPQTPLGPRETHARSRPRTPHARYGGAAFSHVHAAPLQLRDPRLAERLDADESLAIQPRELRAQGVDAHAVAQLGEHAVEHVLVLGIVRIFGKGLQDQKPDVFNDGLGVLHHLLLSSRRWCIWCIVWFAPWNCPNG